MKNDKKFLKTKRKLTELFHMPPEDSPPDEAPANENMGKKFLTDMSEYDASPIEEHNDR